jgi:CRP-like cAMP-binding protein
MIETSSPASALASGEQTLNNGFVERLSREQVSQFLAEETIFRGAPPAAIGRLSDVPLQRLVKEGYALFSAGQPCEALHFVVEGCGILVKNAPDGRQRILHRAISGEMVGAVPFFDGLGYPVSFVAESECLVLSFPRERLLALFASDPALSLAIVGGLVERLRMMVSMVEQMSFEDTVHRLWDFLLQSSTPKAGDDFPRTLESLPTREHIANAIGTVREVVSRRLSRLVESGHIRIEGRRLVMLKPLK